MASKFTVLSKKGLVSLPREVKDGLVYEVITGSESYGIADTSQNSDTDLVAVCIPSKDNIFPHLKGEVQGFGVQTVPFTTWQKHHIIDKDDNKEYDLTAYGIIKFFNLLINNNPNILDVLFCHRSSVVFSTQLSELMRENRKLFLSKLSHKTCVGYAYSQLHKIKTKRPLPESKRYESYVKVGYDTKYATHLCRLVLQCEQILMEHDLDIQRNREFLRYIRNGEWTLSQVEQFFEDKERHLGDLYIKSTLRARPDEGTIKKLLFNCLEIHYGSLDKCITAESDMEKDLKLISDIAKKYNY